MDKADNRFYREAVEAGVPDKRHLCCKCGFQLPTGNGAGLRHYGTGTAHQEYECLALLRAEINRLSIGHARYETARRMNPRQWADAWKLNLRTGKGFDQIIDEMRPLMRSSDD